MLVGLLWLYNASPSQPRSPTPWNGDQYLYLPVTTGLVDDSSIDAKKQVSRSTQVAQPSPQAQVKKTSTPVPKPKPSPVVRFVRATNKARGTATWFCEPGRSRCTVGWRAGGMYAAAGSELRVGDWRGRGVQVCTKSRCVNVKLIDWCACKGERVIDLYGAAFKKLAPLGTGVIQVTVKW